LGQDLILLISPEEDSYLKEYELAVIFDSSLEEDKIDKEIEKQTSLLEKEKCEIVKIDKWGVKDSHIQSKNRTMASIPLSTLRAPAM